MKQRSPVPMWMTGRSVMTAARIRQFWSSRTLPDQPYRSSFESAPLLNPIPPRPAYLSKPTARSRIARPNYPS
jgi:hypothetical protein